MSNVLLRKNYIADAAITPWTIVKVGSDSSHVATATTAADAMLGVTGEVGPASGERVDISLAGIEYVVAGAAFSAGVALTSDGSGRAIAAAPATGVNVTTIGTALEAASAAGDVVRVLLGLGSLQG